MTDTPERPPEDAPAVPGAAEAEVERAERIEHDPAFSPAAEQPGVIAAAGARQGSGKGYGSLIVFVIAVALVALVLLWLL